MSKDQYSARKALAFRIREARRVKRYSQKIIAEISGLNRSYIGAVERAEHNIGIDNIEKIASGLGVPITHLVDAADPALESDHEHPANILAIEPVIHAAQFLALVRQCAGDRPDLLLIYLERCGCRFIEGR